MVNKENNIQFNQLMLTDSGELTLKQRQFVDLHKQICYNAQATTESFVNFVKNIKKMKDEQLYLAAGYSIFEEYTENALRIKQRQAYYYVSIAEKLPESFIRGNADLGVTKLSLLTTLDESEREELIERINLEEASSREISAEIKALKAERDEAQKQLSITADELLETKKEKKALSEKYSEAVSAAKGLAKKNEDLETRLEKAQKAAVSPEVVYQPDMQTVADLQAAQKRNQELEEEDSKKAARISELEEKLKAKKEKDEKKKSIELEAAERKLKEMAAELEEAKAKKTTIADDSLLTFKVKFGDLQRIGGEIQAIIDGSDEETADKLRNAVRAVITKWQGGMKL